MLYPPASGNWGFCGRKDIAWQEVVSVRQQEGEHSQLVITWSSPQPRLRLEPPELFLVFLSTVWLQLRVGCALCPGILPIRISYSVSLGFTFFICKMGRIEITPSMLSEFRETDL